MSRFSWGAIQQPGKLLLHHKSISGAKKEAESYRAWVLSLIAAGAAEVKTISQTELKESSRP